MKSVVVISILMMVLTGCQQAADPDQSDAAYDAIIQQTLAPGHYEEFFFEADYLSAVVMDFQAKPRWGDDEDQSLPRVALMLKNQDRSVDLSVAYYLTEEPYVAIAVFSGDEVWFEEVIDAPVTVSQLSLKLEEGNVFINAGDFEHAMGIPFKAEFLSVMNVSVEVTNNLDFIYR